MLKKQSGNISQNWESFIGSLEKLPRKLYQLEERQEKNGTQIILRVGSEFIFS